MKLQNILFLLIVTLLCACDSPLPEKGIEDDGVLLPLKIVTKASYDAEPWFDYTHTTSFEYDDLKRPVLIRYRSERVHTTSKKEELASENEMSFTYPDENTIKRINTGQRLSYDDNEMVPWEEVRQYTIDFSGLVSILKNDKYKETITIDEENKTITYDGVSVFTYPVSPEDRLHPFTFVLLYDNKGNILESKTINTDYPQATKYKTDNKNGIYKNVNLPHWFLATQLQEIQDEEEHLYNNAVELAVKSGSSTKYSTYGTNAYKYNAEGYPVEKVFSPDMNWIGVWGNSCVIEYTTVE